MIYHIVIRIIVQLFEQYQSPIRLLFEYKEATELEREEIHTRKVP